MNRLPRITADERRRLRSKENVDLGKNMLGTAEEFERDLHRTGNGDVDTTAIRARCFARAAADLHALADELKHRSQCAACLVDAACPVTR